MTTRCGEVPWTCAGNAANDIPKLAEAHAADRVESYFPVFQVNPV